MKPLLIVAGGTGGHVYPALSLALELIQEGRDVLFLTDRRGVRYLENHLDVLKPVVLPLDRKGVGVGGLLKLIFQFIHSFFVSLKYVLKTKSIIGFSGFPTFATLVAGLVTGRALFVHEQNAVLGKVNRWLSPFLKKIFTSTKTISKVPPKARLKIQIVGIPVRSDIAALLEAPYEMPTDKIHLLMTGGSQGAQSFSNVIPKAISLLPQSLQQRLVITHQVREADQSHAKTLYAQTKVGTLKIVSFVEDMAGELRKAHLAIVRSGASTIAELCAAGRPSIMIPYPFATDDHQTFNAHDVTRLGGGWLIAPQDFNPERLCVLLLDLLEHPKKLLVASQCVKGGYLKSSIKVLAQSL